jgi:tRNA threonylcarbamoyladenosine biosynthesis protein TsaE
VKFQSNSEAETREIGFTLGKKIKRGDVVCLYGELGSGKTTMVKGIARALGISERDITSASFSIIVEYDSDIPFYHIDLYRIENNEVASLGLHEYIGMEGISVIEWAERAENDIPDNSIKVTLEYTGENSREVWVDGISLDKED